MYSISAHLYNTTSGFDSPTTIASHIHSLLSKNLNHHHKITPSILDTGCGTGSITIKIAEQEPKWCFTGVDQSSAMLAMAKAHTQAHQQKLPITWTQWDISSKDDWDNQPKRHYDAILCLCNTINHIPSDKLPVLLNGWANTLKEKGILIFDTDTYRMFQECLDHEPLTVFEDHSQRMIRSCQFDSITAQAHHTTRMEHLTHGKISRCEEESHTLFYHPEHQLSELANRYGFQTLSAEPFNPFSDEDMGESTEDEGEAIYKILWVLQQSNIES